MKMFMQPLVALAIAVGTTHAGAASIWVDPENATVDIAQGYYSVGVWMNFGNDEPTLGGGIDIDLRGPVSFDSFAPSAWFQSIPDPAFSGHGTTFSQQDYEVHFGHFNGLSGNNLLGTLKLKLEQTGLADIDLSINPVVGQFYTAAGAPQVVSLMDASVLVTAVPEPGALALFLAGGAFLGLRLKRSR